MKRVFVSGTYDVIHAGHIQFFEDAKALGDHLTVCFASDDVLMMYKGRKPSMPEDNKRKLLESIKYIDQVVMSSNPHPIFDFVDHIKTTKPNILAVTDDDRHIDKKREFCKKYSIELVILPKRNLLTRTSTTQVRNNIKGITQVPLRVDFAGGWLDVPKLSKKGGYIVNCAISPLVSLDKWPYEKGAGLGGSAAFAILEAKNGSRSELNLGVGWQDPAIIEETGLCVWRSGKIPILDFKTDPEWLNGRMMILWSGKTHSTPNIVDKRRDYKMILRAGKIAMNAVKTGDFSKLCRAIKLSYAIQIKEGMDEVPKVKGSKAWKYLGGGHGGYILYLFQNRKARDIAAATMSGTKAIEPYIRNPFVL
ncbi:MAG: adenylyltransferase/cytidyltransferase family protein [Patescibacteria group bacterium]|nr:adenylyltransferase/cytidyltransferase family protein [Patescibacteria group bacterium]